MPDTIIESVLNGKLDSDILTRWLNNESIDDVPDDCILHCCKRSEFVNYFLSYLRSQTDRILQTNTNAVQILQNSTPEKLLSSRIHHRSVSDPTNNDRSTDSLSVRSDNTSQSPNRDRKRTGRRVKTKLFSEEKKEANLSISSDESRLSSSADRIAVTSTPLKNGITVTEYPNLSLTSPVTPKTYKENERCDTPRLSHRHSRSHEKNCLVDYLVIATKSSKKKSKKNVSSDKEERTDLDLSNSEMFPEIGARKSSSLRLDKKRIKPTHIDQSQKSLSLNSFSSECFQQPSVLAIEDNSAFKQQKIQPKELSQSFDVERNILKQERHKLMEKFNILNTTPQAQVSPQIKITKKESIDVKHVYIKADISKLVFKEKIDTLLDIYDSLFKNNLILSVNTELYFLISILLSKQNEEDYLEVERKLADNNVEYLLRSIHNSTYFAVKALWNERATLEVILDKNSLKTLGETKPLRLYSPELAKFVLNTYCVRCEGAPPAAPRRAPTVVTYNIETDHQDNFSGMHAFHHFKKQRDAFYDIVRCYPPSPALPAPPLRSRVRALVSGGSANAHLAKLVVQHMIGTCLVHGAQESKLSKLHRRLTCPTAPDSHRLSHFTTAEMFYKEFIMYAESESFRVHLKDVLCCEILALDGTHLQTGDKDNANSDTTKEYLQLSKKLNLLAKFLGYVTALPYTATPTEILSKNNNVVVLNKEQMHLPPKEKVLQNNIALRDYSQPSIDLKGILQKAIDNNRLSITVPWIVQYLSMLDYTTLRLSYYTEILKKLHFIYKNKLKTTPENKLKKNTIIYLKSIMGWLFDLPHFPLDCNERIDSSENIDNFIDANVESIDTFDLVDESSIIELCPSLKDVNVLLSTCKLSEDRRDGSFRHITPVSLTVNPADRIKNKEKELQSRLEEELVRAQPSSTRRVLEVVVERAGAAALKDIRSIYLPAAAAKCRAAAQELVKDARVDQDTLVQMVTSLYSSHLAELRSTALEAAKTRLRARTRDALTALLPSAPAPLHHVAYKAALNKLTTWINEHWNNTGVLCKDIPGEVLAPAAGSHAPPPVTHSLATELIHLKEHVCLLLEDSPPSPLPPLLHTLAALAAAGGLARKPIAQLTVDLCVVYVAKKPTEVTESFLNKLHIIWNILCPDRKRHEPEELTLPERREGLSPQLRNFEDDERAITPISDEEGTVEATNVESGAKEVESGAKMIDSNAKGIDVGAKGVESGANMFDCGAKAVDKSTKADKKVDSDTDIVNTIRIVDTPTKQANDSTTSINSSLTQLTITPQNAKLKTNLKPNIYKSRSIPSSPTYLSNNFGKNIYSKSIPTSPISLTPTYFKTVNNVTVKNVSVKNVSENANLDENDVISLFNRILCSRNIVMLSVSKCEQRSVWACLANVLVFLLKNDYLSEDSLTEQCLAVYRQDWPQNILENLSTCMKTVSSKWAHSSSGKFTLFLDFLAEYCGDMDYELTD